MPLSDTSNCVLDTYCSGTNTIHAAPIASTASVTAAKSASTTGSCRETPAGSQSLQLVLTVCFNRSVGASGGAMLAALPRPEHRAEGPEERPGDHCPITTRYSGAPKAMTRVPSCGGSTTRSSARGSRPPGTVSSVRTSADSSLSSTSAVRRASSAEGR